jgi:hypothetical protein
MAKAPKEEVGTLSETCEPAIHLDTYVVGRRRECVPERLCDMALASLLGIHIRRIRWEPCHCKVGLRGDIVLDDHGSMRVEPSPDDDHRPGDGPLEVAQGPKTIRGTDGMRKLALVDFAGQRQANHRGQFPAFTHAPEARRPPPRRPGRAGLGATREAGFIDEDDCRAAAASLLLMRGQSWVNHACTQASSRSRA